MEPGEQTVVVVDDDPVILKVVEHTVRKQGLRCLTFTSPINALKHILRWPPNAVITDFNMPSLNGLELVVEIRDRLGAEAPPCLILSANPDEEIITQAFETGVADYLCKPFAAGELKVKLKRVLDQSNSRGRAGVPRISERLTIIGEYEVLRELGRGGMGVVYAVNHPKYDGELALKTLHARNDDVEAMLRFRREIDVLTNLSHPALVRFYGAGKAQGMSYYVMDLVDGESLRDRITMDGSLPGEEMATVLYIVASALGYLHSHGLVHRDVTPGNILLPSDGRVRLADFGLAKHVSDAQLTASQDMLGTPNYMSPETIIGKPLDGRSDLFSLGMCGLAGLMGETPIQAENPYAVMRSIMAHEYPSATSYDVPLALGQAIDELLRVDVERRTPDAQSFMRAIAELVPPEVVARYTTTGADGAHS